VSQTAFGDLLAALGLMLVLEGMALAIFTGRLPEILEQLKAVGSDGLRWAGLAMAIAGTGLYVLVRS
jgi:uncharacterized protein YjeT (DUF2065 family)